MARKPRKPRKSTPHVRSQRGKEGLTPKQELFAQAYVETANASAAYRRAYDTSDMKDTSVHVAACKQLAHGKTWQRIEQLQLANLKRHEVTVDKVVRELSLLGFSNMMDYMRTTDSGDAYVDFPQLTREQAAAISEVTSEVYTEGGGEDARQVKRTKFKLSDKRAALVDLGKHLGIFVERKEVSGPKGAPIEISVKDTTNLELARWIAFQLAQATPIKTIEG